MQLAPANGCALMQSAFGVLPEGTKFADAAEQGPRRDFVVHEAGGKRDRRPLPRPLWQNEAKKPRSLKRLQPGADREPGKASEANPSCAAESVGVEADQRVGVLIPSVRGR